MDVLVCSLLIVFLLSPLVYHAESLSFHYESIDNTTKADFGTFGDDCTFERRGAYLTGVVGSKNYHNSRGRLQYPTKMQLWDAATSEAASFTTTFSFGIEAVPGEAIGNGMAFYLTNQTDLSNVGTDPGGNFGLFSKPDDHIFAVEFDTFRDDWDPSDRHIGVDLNSTSSDKYVTLPNDSFVDQVMSARIEYDSGTGRLDVVLHNGSRDRYNYSLSATVDLRSFLPEQVTVGFSAATSTEQVALHYVLAWSFNSTLPPVVTARSPRRRAHTPLVAGVIAASVLALMLSAVVGVVLWRSRRQSTQERSDASSAADDDSWPIEEDLESGSGPRPFQLSKLTAATRNFSEEEKLGQGASGSVYRGRVDELDVAIKVFSRGSSAQGKREYTSEVTVISRLRHRNLVQLIGWCDGRKKLLLVYELVPNGSVDRHLYSETNAALPWPARYRIMLGLGAAVLYLHQEWEQCVIHGDIKPSNIMLDESFDAKLGDFGLARLIDHGVGLQTMTAVAGTPGYLDPECISTGKASTESDVYSFGVVLLEVATGRRPMVPPPPGVKRIFRLVEWAWDLYGRDAVLQAADVALQGEFDPWEMELAVVVGLWCAHPDSRARPSIRQAVEALRSGDTTKLPALPPKMPVAMYVQPYAPSDMHIVDDTFTATTSVTASSHGDRPPAVVDEYHTSVTASSHGSRPPAVVDEYHTSVTASSHGGRPPAVVDEYHTMSTTWSIPHAGSKQSVRLLRGR